MNHLEYIRKIDNAKVCILFIHGIVGSPNHFDEFIKYVPNEYSIYNILLDGHGKSVKDFSKTSKRKWLNQIDNLLNELSNKYENIYIMSHSMGTLFTLNSSLKYNKIKGAFLLAPPLRIILKPSMIKTSLKICFNKIKETDIKTLEARRCYSIKQDKNLFKYLAWIPRFLDLFSLSKSTRKIIKDVGIDTFVYLSKCDEVVSLRGKKLLEQNEKIQVSVLPKSSHFYYEKCDKEYLLDEFKKFISKIKE